MIRLAIKSLMNRRASVLLTVIAIAVSVTLLLAVERVREQVQSHFANTVSGTDLIIGARTGQTQLLLSSVFHIGSMTNNMSWESFEDIRERPEVSWAIPMSLGDSVQGLPVVATTNAYFEHFKYGNKQALEFSQGSAFASDEEVVLGADAAEKLSKTMGDDIIIAHGSGGISFSEHDQHPLTVTGVLQRTGTPVDQAVFVTLHSLEMIHSGEHEHSGHDHHNEAPADSISAALLGLKAKPLALRLQRQINTYEKEPLTALLPGMTLQELWKTLRVFEQALTAISAMVVLIGLLGMLTIMLASLRERRREMAVLRAVGAGPGTIFGLLLSEALLLTVVGAFSGLLLLYGLQWSLAGVIQSQTGLILSTTWPGASEWWRMALVIIVGFMLSLIPAWRAYRQSLADGLTVKI
ncbi:MULTISPECIES: ABC transporter permease [Idiomarina]|jgi:putative ABC transport system permease protein|uniref:ABC transporter permease n=2 Tax=Idiomarina TaxID=135575 RepID=A0A8I1G8G8_9GAMM|nr:MULTISPECIES: ABC transporter permease [Idiomarina]KPD21534.1 ABC transporter permease [Idiomarina abyssalis]MAB21936.1 ABC transporter permease [Idiomarina sp.]MAO68206.1 ABC transporter permease [Idiomarina sp.]MBF81387.1 ABC transporter permease [Idiomarina sp.]MBH94190.1 ABC transporter permease [Idiomarina sp.]|tara:strand:- start:628 stop:1854 length:1227 start_codon:yes stop_codon:yes gene_type:complete